MEGLRYLYVISSGFRHIVGPQQVYCMSRNDDHSTPCRTCGNKSACFETLYHEDLDDVNKHRSEIRFKKGENIVKQGDFVNNIYYIQSGMAKVYKEADNRHIILNIMPEGYYIGLPFMYGSNIFQYSATAIVDCTICSIELKTFRDLINRNASFAEKLIQLLNHCSLQNFDRFVSLTQKQTNGRLADSLIYLADEVYKSQIFRLDLSRKDLAELASMSTMSAIHTLKDFRDNGIIRDDNGQFEILDMDMLKRISRIG